MAETEHLGGLTSSIGYLKEKMGEDNFDVELHTSPENSESSLIALRSPVDRRPMVDDTSCDTIENTNDSSNFDPGDNSQSQEKSLCSADESTNAVYADANGPLLIGLSERTDDNVVVNKSADSSSLDYDMNLDDSAISNDCIETKEISDTNADVISKDIESLNRTVVDRSVETESGDVNETCESGAKPISNIDTQVEDSHPNELFDCDIETSTDTSRNCTDSDVIASHSNITPGDACEVRDFVNDAGVTRALSDLPDDEYEHSPGGGMQTTDDQTVMTEDSIENEIQMHKNIPSLDHEPLMTGDEIHQLDDHEITGANENVDDSDIPNAMIENMQVEYMCDVAEFCTIKTEIDTDDEQTKMTDPSSVRESAKSTSVKGADNQSPKNIVNNSDAIVPAGKIQTETSTIENPSQSTETLCAANQEALKTCLTPNHPHDRAKSCDNPVPEVNNETNRSNCDESIMSSSVNCSDVSQCQATSGGHVTGNRQPIQTTVSTSGDHENHTDHCDQSQIGDCSDGEESHGSAEQHIAGRDVEHGDGLRVVNTHNEVESNGRDSSSNASNLTISTDTTQYSDVTQTSKVHSTSYSPDSASDESAARNSSSIIPNTETEKLLNDQSKDTEKSQSDCSAVMENKLIASDESDRHDEDKSKSDTPEQLCPKTTKFHVDQVDNDSSGQSKLMLDKDRSDEADAQGDNVVDACGDLVELEGQSVAGGASDRNEVHTVLSEDCDDRSATVESSADGSASDVERSSETRTESVERSVTPTVNSESSKTPEPKVLDDVEIAEQNVGRSQTPEHDIDCHGTGEDIEDIPNDKRSKSDENSRSGATEDSDKRSKSDENSRSGATEDSDKRSKSDENSRSGATEDNDYRSKTPENNYSSSETLERNGDRSKTHENQEDRQRTPEQHEASLKTVDNNDPCTTDEHKIDGVKMHAGNDHSSETPQQSAITSETCRTQNNISASVCPDDISDDSGTLSSCINSPKTAGQLVDKNSQETCQPDTDLHNSQELIQEKNASVGLTAENQDLESVKTTEVPTSEICDKDICRTSPPEDDKALKRSNNNSIESDILSSSNQNKATDSDPENRVIWKVSQSPPSGTSDINKICIRKVVWRAKSSPESSKHTDTSSKSEAQSVNRDLTATSDGEDRHCWKRDSGNEREESARLLSKIIVEKCLRKADLRDKDVPSDSIKEQESRDSSKSEKTSVATRQQSTLKTILRSKTVVDNKGADSLPSRTRPRKQTLVAKKTTSPSSDSVIMTSQSSDVSDTFIVSQVNKRKRKQPIHIDNVEEIEIKKEKIDEGYIAAETGIRASLVTSVAPSRVSQTYSVSTSETLRQLVQNTTSQSRLSALVTVSKKNGRRSGGGKTNGGAKRMDPTCMKTKLNPLISSILKTSLSGVGERSGGLRSSPSTSVVAENSSPDKTAYRQFKLQKSDKPGTSVRISPDPQTGKITLQVSSQGPGHGIRTTTSQRFNAPTWHQQRKLPNTSREQQYTMEPQTKRVPDVTVNQDTGMSRTELPFPKTVLDELLEATDPSKVKSRQSQESAPRPQTVRSSAPGSGKMLGVMGNFTLIAGQNLLPRYTAAQPDPELEIKEPFLTHACTVCGDSFLFKDSLLSHMNRKSIHISFNCKNHCKKRMVFHNRCVFLEYVLAKKCTNIIENVDVKPVPESLMSSEYQILKANESRPPQPVATTSTTTTSSSSTGGSTNATTTVSPVSESGPTVLSTHSLRDMTADVTSANNSSSIDGEDNFQCLECRKWFKSKEERKNHFSVDKPKQVSLIQCNKCSMMMNQLCQFKAHARVHMNRRPFVCPECGENRFVSKQVFQRHLKVKCLHFSRQTVFKCMRCNNGFAHPTLVCNHIMKVHTDRYFKCMQCPMAFKGSSTFQGHSENVHNGKATVKTISKCPECETVCHTDAQLQTHFGNHLRKVTSRVALVYKCDLCPQVFGDKNSLCRHMKQSHNTDTTLCMCVFCGVDFRNEDDLKQHMLHSRDSLHNPQIGYGERNNGRTGNAKIGEIVPYDSQLSSPIKKWECKQCAVSFKQEKFFERHMAKHRFVAKRKKASGLKLVIKLDKCNSLVTNAVDKEKLNRDEDTQIPVPSPEPKFICVACNRKFDEETELESHLRSEHSIAPQHPCHLCSLTYEDRKQLAEHLRVQHVGKEKDSGFYCWLCLEDQVQQNFPKRQSLDKHLLAVHKIPKQRIDYSKISQFLPEVKTEDAQEEKTEEVPVKRLKVSGDSKFVCAKCLYSTEEKSDFLRHISKHKRDDDGVQCQECGLIFAVQMSLKRHLFMVHKIKNIIEYLNQCEFSGKSPSKKERNRIGIKASSLPNGYSVAPEPSNPLECTVCKTVFETDIALGRHMRNHGVAFIKARKRMKLTAR